MKRINILLAITMLVMVGCKKKEAVTAGDQREDEKQDQRNEEFVKAIENNTRAVDALTMEIKRS